MPTPTETPTPAPATVALQTPPLSGQVDCTAILSAPGDKIAFLRAQEQTFVDLMHVDTRAWCVLVQAQVTAAPAWSPDSHQIALQVEEAGIADIYLMNADGSDYRRLSSTPGVNRYPVWSPNGEQIAYVSYHDRRSHLYLMNRDGTDVRLLAQSAEGSQTSAPDWAPDGSQLVIAGDFSDGVSAAETGDWEIYTINTDDGALTRLTYNAAYDGYPSWSPNGKVIVYYSRQDGPAVIYTVYPDGAGQQNLTDLDVDSSFPVWSPDGSQIGYVSEHPNDWPRAYVMDSDGSNQSSLYQSGSDQGVPKWSPDSARIIFTQDTWDGSTLILVDADGIYPRFLTRYDRYYGVSWMPTQPE